MDNPDSTYPRKLIFVNMDYDYEIYNSVMIYDVNERNYQIDEHSTYGYMLLEELFDF